MFHVKHSKTTEVKLHLRTSETEVTVIGNFDSESKFNLLDAKAILKGNEAATLGEKNAENRNVAGNSTPNVSLLSQTGRGYIRKQVVENMKLTNANLLPIFTISDTFNRVVWLSQGYTIGLGEQLEAVIKKL